MEKEYFRFSGLQKLSLYKMQDGNLQQTFSIKALLLERYGMNVHKRRIEFYITIGEDVNWDKF